MKIRDHYELTKPRMVLSNVLVAVAAFIFGSGAVIDWKGLLSMFAGLLFVIASACVFNNYFDRRIDARMERTKNRPLAAGRIGAKQALLFGCMLLILGIITLYFHTNTLALGAALLGFFVYVFLYTPLKPKTPLALYVGAIAGATPPVVGYAAATGALDLYALILFLTLYLWQIPHFFVIGVYRYEEYKAAGVPLFIKKVPGEKLQRRARITFYASLGVLLFICLVLILQRWMR